MYIDSWICKVKMNPQYFSIFSTLWGYGTNRKNSYIHWVMGSSTYPKFKFWKLCYRPFWVFFVFTEIFAISEDFLWRVKQRRSFRSMKNGKKYGKDIKEIWSASLHSIHFSGNWKLNFRIFTIHTHISLYRH